jgi:uncharacterized protein (DUF302 family)
MSDYGRRLTVDVGFDEALNELTEAMHAEGLDVVTRFDVRRYLLQHVRRDCRRYVLLQVVSAVLLHEALQMDLDIGAVLPAPVAVYELADGETAVEVVEPFGASAEEAVWRERRPELARLVDAASDRIARAMARLQRLAAAPRP